MRKGILLCGTVIVLAATALALTACGKKENAEVNEAGDHIQVYSPDSAKMLGRTAYHPDSDTVWCSLSGSGIDFQFYGRECKAELIADSSYNTGLSKTARYAVFVNGERVEDKQMTEPSRTIQIVNPGDSADICTVRIIKLSESMYSSIGIGSLTVTTPPYVYREHKKEGVLFPSADKEHYIEFIGDSITCGYGVDGELGGKFSTETEDATKAYAYKTAELLDADYSLISYSGHGVLSGYTVNGQKVKQLVMPYYEEVGHSGASLADHTKIQNDKWDFKKQPDIVVINLGTNDASYTQSDNAKMREYAAEYTNMLKTIRAKNPSAPILCVLGTMDGRLCDATELALINYKEETGDKEVKFIRLNPQSQEADGIGIDYHPSENTHQKTAEVVAPFIRDWMEWD